MIQAFKHRAVLAIKHLLYGRSGEPYRVAGTVLRFVPGTRPVLAKYRTSPNSVVRYDALQVEMVVEQLQPGDFALDIGAHAGQYALIMATRCGPSGKVIAFEPDHYARKVFARNLDLNQATPMPTIEALALSDRSGSATLYSRGGDSNSSLSLSGLPSSALEDLEQLDVTLCTLDDYLEQNGLPVPNLVKIDTEGAEIRILQGAQALLASDAEILCELHPYAWEGFGSSLAELQALLAKSGRQMRYIDEAKAVEGEPIYGVVSLERAA
jgi:FkbM family methyltransferase